MSEHAGSEVGSLGLISIVVGHDMAQGAPLRRTDKGSTMACVSHQVVQFTLVCNHTASETLAFCFCALCDFANDATTLVSVLREPDTLLCLKGDDNLPDLEVR